MVARMQTLWVVCPIFRDVESFLALRTDILAQFQRIDFDAPTHLRFVVVDDTGDQDRELTRLRGLPDVAILHVPFNLGHQRAIVYGLRTLSPDIDPNDWVVTMDADGEDRPADLPRMCRPLLDVPRGANHVVLAWRVKRRESLPFKVLYVCFKVLFRFLTGTVIRTGNYAAFHGGLTKRVLFHPFFDLAYSSALLSLNIPAVFVPCERGTRYAGRSRMSAGALLQHGLRMLMPFIDRIATRALVLFTLLFSAGIAGSLLVLAIKLFTRRAIPGWTSYMLLLIFTVSVTALGNFVIMFVLFAQSSGLSLRGLHGRRLGISSDDARDAPPGTGRPDDAAVLASSTMASRRDDAAPKRSI